MCLFLILLRGGGLYFLHPSTLFPVELCSGVQTQTMALPVDIPIAVHLTLQDPLVLVGEYFSRRQAISWHRGDERVHWSQRNKGPCVCVS